MADAGAEHPSREEEGPLQGLLNWLRQLRGEPERAPSLRAALADMLAAQDSAQPIDPHERSLLVNILKLHEQIGSAPLGADKAKAQRESEDLALTAAPTSHMKGLLR